MFETVSGDSFSSGVRYYFCFVWSVSSKDWLVKLENRKNLPTKSILWFNKHYYTIHEILCIISDEFVALSQISKCVKWRVVRANKTPLCPSFFHRSASSVYLPTPLQPPIITTMLSLLSELLFLSFSYRLFVLNRRVSLLFLLVEHIGGINMTSCSD